MATLTSLKLVAAKKPAQKDPVQHRRAKLSMKVLEQLALCKALNAGEIYAPTRIKTVTNAEGERVQVNQPKRVKQWWFVEGNKVLLQVRYGSKTLMLNGKSNAVECANADALIGALETVNTAVLAGELDAQIEAVSTQIRGGFER
jgi:predicted transcriptional regulator